MGWLLAVALSILTALVPQTSTGSDGYKLGHAFLALVPGKITAIRYYKLPGDMSGPHIGQIWVAAAAVSTVTFTNETASGWQEQALPMPVTLAAGALASVTVTNPQGAHYPILPNYFTAIHVDGPLSYAPNAGVYSAITSTIVPTGQTGHYYFRDVAFVPDLSPTVIITPDEGVPGSYTVETHGFRAGTYTLQVGLKDATQTIMSSVLIQMPDQTVTPAIGPK